MFYKILRKSGIGNKLIKIVSPFITFNGLLPDPVSAKRILNKISPDPANSCICSIRSTESEPAFDLDVIIPCYNSEATIEKCINSVLEQKTSYYFRAIIIDDGSFDSSPSKIDLFSDDPRVCIVHQKNKGFSGARNTGLELSNAEYIMFLDSDDTLCSGALENLMQLVSSGAAIAEGAFNAVDTCGKILSSTVHKEGRINPRTDMSGYFWAKVFKAELFNNICLPLGYWYEDSLMAQIIYPLVERKGLFAAGYGKPVYNYTINPTGISATGRQKPKCIDSLWITLQLYKDRLSLNLENDQLYYEYILNMLRLTYLRCEKLPTEAKTAIFAVWKDFIEKSFSGFSSEIPNRKYLEQAIHTGNFRLYSLVCRLSST